MPADLNASKIRQRARTALRWQDHARLVFEVLHSPSVKEHVHSLVQVYKAELSRAASPVLRWAYAYAGIEVFVAPLYRCRISFLDYWTHQQVFDEMRKVVNATPNEGMGYLGLALAYGRGMYDEQIATYSQKVGEEWTVVTRRGKQERVKIPVYDNPEKWRRFRQNWSKLRSLEPDNPYVSSWQAYDIHYFMVTGKINEATFVYDSNKLKSLGQKALAEEGYRLARKAYEDGFKFFSPVVALGDIIYFAWQVGGRAEAQQWGELFKPWVAQNPQSPYVEQVRTYYGADCPLIRELTRP